MRPARDRNRRAVRPSHWAKKPRAQDGPRRCGQGRPPTLPRRPNPDRASPRSPTRPQHRWPQPASLVPPRGRHRRRRECWLLSEGRPGTTHQRERKREANALRPRPADAPEDRQAATERPARLPMPSPDRVTGPRRTFIEYRTCVRYSSSAICRTVSFAATRPASGRTARSSAPIPPSRPRPRRAPRAPP